MNSILLTVQHIPASILSAHQSFWCSCNAYRDYYLTILVTFSIFNQINLSCERTFGKQMQKISVRDLPSMFKFQDILIFALQIIVPTLLIGRELQQMGGSCPAKINFF